MKWYIGKDDVMNTQSQHTLIDTVHNSNAVIPYVRNYVVNMNTIYD